MTAAGDGNDGGSGDGKNPKTGPKAAAKAPKVVSFTPRVTRDSHVELGRGLIQQLHAVVEGRLHQPVCVEGSIYSYAPDRGIWTRNDDDRCGQLVQKFDGQMLGKRSVKLRNSDVLGAIACTKREIMNSDFFRNAERGVAFKNGLASTERKSNQIVLLPHSPTHRARFAYDFDYTTEEPRALIDALSGMFRDDRDRNSKVRLLCEFAGVCMLGLATQFQRWILLKGLGDDGKSTTIELLRAAMPPGSTCSIGPKDLEDEYSRADLVGKLLNTVAEIRQREILDSEALKAVVAGDPMRGREIRKTPIEFKPIAGNIYAANGFPKFSDASHGFWRRPIVVVFNRCFTGDPEREIGLADRIVRAELPQVVSFFLRSGVEAIRRGSFIEPESHDDAMREWRSDSDAVFEFVSAWMVATKSQPTKKQSPPSLGWSQPSEIYKYFLSWAQDTGHRELSSTALGRRLTELGYPELRTHGVRYRPLRRLRAGERKLPDGSLDGYGVDVTDVRRKVLVEVGRKIAPQAGRKIPKPKE